MTKLEMNLEIEAHQVMKRMKRSRVLAAYFSLKDNEIPDFMDIEEGILYLIPIEYYESFFAACLPGDTLTSRIANLES